MAFKVSKCAEEDKVTYAAFMMKYEALFWWERNTNLRGEEAVARMSWDEFKVLFNEKFCPRTVVKQLEEEFLRLEQGSLTVREYMTSFTEKARFSEHYVSTKERRVELEVRENEIVRQESERGQLKRKWEGSNNEARRQKAGNSERKVWQGQSGKPCPKCNLVHKGECLVKPRVCYRCGKAGHLSQDCRMERRERLCYMCKSPNHVQADCPQRKKDVTAIQGGSRREKGDERRLETPRPKGRVFQMTTTEVEETPNV
ncbi:uncharacterized protein LOC112503424 [Cynara cardunculus var. scolymus]|uniref:uncharacterized protein LOC112503424 n=1 Tax=Cynara cardunculus var. scolymus TaxID=59895 RepID=UPI000D62CEDF|nr:uncharacterized protein LOC112503424 [Cynara cardunculus var. scolymus]